MVLICGERKKDQGVVRKEGNINIETEIEKCFTAQQSWAIVQFVNHGR
jgi:hypothetical protein